MSQQMDSTPLNSRWELGKGRNGCNEPAITHLSLSEVARCEVNPCKLCVWCIYFRQVAIQLQKLWPSVCLHAEGEQQDDMQ